MKLRLHPLAASLPSPSSPVARRIAAAACLCSAAFLAACDGGVLADTHTVSLSEDGQHVVIEQEWTLPLGANRGDVLFDRATVSPGNVVVSSFSGAEHAVVLTSSYDEAIGRHRVGIDVEGVSVNYAELIFQGHDDRRHLAASAESVIDLPEPEVSAAPASVHYGYASDDAGNQVLVVSYDYHNGGATGLLPETARSAAAGEGRSGAPHLVSPEAGAGMDVEYVGYRLVLDEPVPGWSRLRVSGYDELEIGKASFAHADGKTAPARPVRRGVLAADVKASLSSLPR